MKKTALSLIFLAATLARAQTPKTFTLGSGRCPTSAANTYYCNDIAVNGLGTPGYTFASFEVYSRSGPVTGYFYIIDNATNTVYVGTFGQGASIVPPSSDSADSITLDTGVRGQAGSSSMQGVMGTACPPHRACVPIFVNGTATIWQ